ncbi:hypothetical protein LIER_04535 [Lithospermum erythrorhizon]|uniref:Morc S5 domain-containing protein n=1 Tax=Lithospermum erythrorhizon TaxID=34254 RepID=A0AAV3P190_LITER
MKQEANKDNQLNSLIDLSSSSSESEGDDVADGGSLLKKRRVDDVLPLGFLDPLPIKESLTATSDCRDICAYPLTETSCKQFWKAGDYEATPGFNNWDSTSGGMDHVRVHPKFLHSNATSHKWVLGAFAELLDNSLDEVCNGATYVNIDMILNKKDGNKMLSIEDNGGGMDPDKLRQCMSLGYSVKSKLANTIGQYGNGFKTSTMRLGADVIVFSRCHGNGGNRPTESIGLLSYTFLRSTGKEDIVVPMLDYEKRGLEWSKLMRSSVSDWDTNIDTIVQWSPFSSEAELLEQFNNMKDQGTRIIIYNLWEDDQGLLELDFEADRHDIQIRGVNRDEKSIQMAQQYPNSKHFLTYRHSLRSYASILYLRIPPGFRIILRGKDVEHHNIVNDMMMTQEITYRPQPGSDGIPKDTNLVASVTVGFVKDAKSHIDVQGFNVYHKNRLIKPFWRLWHAPGSDGRGVIGVLEANFVEPAHDKQGFERTTVLSRLEGRLVSMQKTYWSTYCHKIGYAPRRNKKALAEEGFSGKVPSMPGSRRNNSSNGKSPASGETHSDRHERNGRNKASGQKGVQLDLSSSSSEEDDSDEDVQTRNNRKRTNGFNQKSPSSSKFTKNGSQKVMHSPPGFRDMEAEENGSGGRVRRSATSRAKVMHSPPGFSCMEAEENGSGGRVRRSTTSRAKGDDATELSQSKSDSCSLNLLKEENRLLKERLKKKEEEMLGDLLNDFQQERDRCKSLEIQLQEANHKIESMNAEQESLIDIFAEERQRRDQEEEDLRKKLKEATTTIKELSDKIKLLKKK